MNMKESDPSFSPFLTSQAGSAMEDDSEQRTWSPPVMLVSDITDATLRNFNLIGCILHFVQGDDHLNTMVTSTHWHSDSIYLGDL